MQCSVHSRVSCVAYTEHLTIPSKSYAWQATRLQTRASSTGPLCFGFCVWSPNLLSLEDIDLPLHKHTLSAAIDECLFKQLITTVPSTWAQALALSSSLPHAGDWLNVVPSPHLGLNFHHQEFRCCLQYWLGIPLHSNSYPCPECCCMADPFGDHQVECRGNVQGGYKLMLEVWLVELECLISPQASSNLSEFLLEMHYGTIMVQLPITVVCESMGCW